ncbi:MAG: PAS domain-containing protein, partial [Alphaproteobacteria bacterium]
MQSARPLRATSQALPVDVAGVISALPVAIIALDADDRIVLVNAAAESFLEASSPVLSGSPLRAHLSPDSPLFSLVRQARDRPLVDRQRHAAIA